MKTRLIAKTVTTVGLFLCAALLLVVAPASAAERIERTIKVGSSKRSYIAFLPSSSERSKQKTWPVLMAFHPGLATGEFMEKTAAFHRASGGDDYIVVYPNGMRRTWNAGDCCGRARALNVDDLGFFKAMMADLGSLISVEPRAYLTGFSNGAILAYHIACKNPKQVAAIAPFASAYSGTKCNSGNIPVLHIHGAADISAPVNGGTTQIKSFDNKRIQVPARKSVEAFAKRDGCSTSRKSEVVIKPLKTSCERYTQCNVGSATLCIVDKLGHTWPGASASNSVLGRKFGPGRTDINGTQAILSFFNGQR